MSKRNKGAVDSDGGTAVLEAPAPVKPIATALTERRPFTVNFRRVDTGGNPRAHEWLPWCVTIEDCESAAEARKKLHELLDQAIFQVAPASY